ncbi:hypothetical protein ARMGADRAFT_1029410 [Armillaria gallica]|uniref:Uncharacterized protein n=1 Tax=Armillaria gallica TaxID=47427 RepID=A0A2H3DGC2_ARMGA|nr:hypothetical protein ARMGADRAFT_1029410 [Armillaria gallica]
MGTIADAFRIFAEGDECPSVYYHAENEPNTLDGTTIVYTDGSAIKGGTEEAAAGAGIFYKENDIRNRSIRLPNEVGRTNQVSEIVGAKTAAEDVPTSSVMELISHSGNPGNEGADQLARIASEKTVPDLIDLTIPPELRTQGAKLAAMTQAMAYKIIRKMKMQMETYQDKLDRRDTNHNVRLALAAAGERCQAENTVEQLWISVRRKDFNRSAHFFIWMLLHNGCEDRVECKECNTEENMDHILTKCEAPGQREIWDLAQQLWKQKTGSNLVITKGTIMSCGIQLLNMHRSRNKQATERFHRILISESVHLIWKIRNDRVINERPNYTSRKIEQRWSHVINRWMRLDCILSDKKKFQKKAIRVPLVLKTWRGTLLHESSFPEDWTRENRVLVDIVK